MCYFVTIAVRVEHADTLERSVPRSLALRPVASVSVLRALPTGYPTYVLTSGTCSCELFQMPAAPAMETSQERAARLCRKYAQRGWSDAKVARAVAQAAYHAWPEPPFVGLRPDVRTLLADWAEEIGRLAVVCHWYHGEVAAEKFAVASGPEVPAVAWRQGTVSFPPDVIVFVKA